MAIHYPKSLSQRNDSIALFQAKRDEALNRLKALCDERGRIKPENREAGHRIASALDFYQKKLDHL